MSLDLLSLKYSDVVNPFRCYEFVQKVFADNGTILPDHDKINTFKDGEFVKIEIVEPMSILVFSTKHPLANHVGVVTNDISKFIHLSSVKGVVRQKLNPFWMGLLIGIYKWKAK